MLIKTRYLCPTNYKGARIAASAIGCDYRKIFAWDDELSPHDNHMKACKEIAAHIWRNNLSLMPEFVGAWASDACYWIRTDSYLKA